MFAADIYALILEWLYDCQFNIMFLFGLNKLILLVSRTLRVTLVIATYWHSSNAQ